MPQSPWERAKSGTEHGEQSALFIWSRVALHFGVTAANTPDAYKTQGVAQALLAKHNDKVEEFQWLHAIHNQGHGDAIRGAKAKAEGVVKGVADVFLPAPHYCTKADARGYNANWAGLYIEMKREGGGRISEDQAQFAAYCDRVGYKHEFCDGWQQAATALLRYLERDLF